MRKERKKREEKREKKVWKSKEKYVKLVLGAPK